MGQLQNIKPLARESKLKFPSYGEPEAPSGYWPILRGLSPFWMIMRIRNWEKWQTYRKDRGTPPWIKIHRNLFSNPEWAYLSDGEKGQLVSIWILASDKGGDIPSSGEVIQKLCMLDSKPDLFKFAELGFICERCQPDGHHEVTT